MKICKECSSIDGHGNECPLYIPGLSHLEVHSLMSRLVKAMPDAQRALLQNLEPDLYKRLMAYVSTYEEKHD